MPALRHDLVGRIHRLPKPSNAAGALQPLFEAISNSLHSTASRFGESIRHEGRVDIEIALTRKKDHVTITVEDNGRGLDDRNWDAFLTADTSHKMAIGGKGVGRLMWLDCFSAINVVSVFETGEGFRERSFRFTLDRKNAIGDYAETDSDATSSGFRVTFSGLRDNGYEQWFPGRDKYVFTHFMSHFLPAFINERTPVVTLTVNGVERRFPDAIDEIVSRMEQDIEISTADFGILRLTMMECHNDASADRDGKNFVHFIAHDRTVESRKIDSVLGFGNFGDNGDRVFQAIVRGEFLDDKVNQERTAFTFGPKVLDDIINHVLFRPYFERFLKEPLEDHRSHQRSKIEDITSTYPSVSLGSTEELQKMLPPGQIDDEAIFGRLSLQRYRQEKNQARKIKDVLARLKGGEIDADDFEEALVAANKAMDEIGQRSLAEYVVRRKVVLDFMEVLLRKVRNDERDSAYQREDLLHSFICPLRVDMASRHRNIDASPAHDLWILDERLAMAQYFSSDTNLGRLIEDEKSLDRPDLLVFDHVHGMRTSDSPSSAIILVEFKRPGRSEYKNGQSPVVQVSNYVQQLMSGDVRDYLGRPMPINRSTVFHCFIIADIVGDLKKETWDWAETPGGHSRYRHAASGFIGTIEVMGWDALLNDAKARNDAFFGRIGITGRSLFSDVEVGA